MFCLLGSLVFMNAAFADKVLYDSNHQAVQLSKLKDKWVIVSYWAEWCPTCMKEIPELNRFNKMKNNNIVFYGVNYDQPSAGELKRMASRSHIAFPQLVQSPNYAWRLGEIEAVPALFIINPQGKLVKKIIGENTAESLMATLEDLGAIKA